MRMRLSCYVACGMETATDLVTNINGVDAFVVVKLRLNLDFVDCDRVVSWQVSKPISKE